MQNKFSNRNKQTFNRKKIECAFCGGREFKIGTFECREVIKPEEVINKFESMINF
ncbi:MAG: hypothetical protein KHX06_08300 [Brachyspira sp.]|nr:hypothetical protein [Brachyspira sp.]